MSQNQINTSRVAFEAALSDLLDCQAEGISYPEWLEFFSLHQKGKWFMWGDPSFATYTKALLEIMVHGLDDAYEADEGKFINYENCCETLMSDLEKSKGVSKQEKGR